MNTPSGSVLFFNKIAPFVPAAELEVIQTAYAFSKYGHRNQLRDDGTRYFDHPRAVAQVIFEDFGIFDYKSIAMGLLHDVSEDTFLLTEYRLRMNFGKSISWGVRLLTKDALSKAAYYPRLKSCGKWRVILVKICDRLHNMSTLGNCPREKQIKQVLETRMHFFELCVILEGLIPKKYHGKVALMRERLNALCTQYQ